MPENTGRVLLYPKVTSGRLGRKRRRRKRLIVGLIGGAIASLLFGLGLWLMNKPSGIYGGSPGPQYSLPAR